jgi:hypothetical protein
VPGRPAMAYYLRGPPSSSSQEGLRWSTVAEHSICYRCSSRAPLGRPRGGLRWPTLLPGASRAPRQIVSHRNPSWAPQSSPGATSPRPHASRTASPGPESSHARRVPGGYQLDTRAPRELPWRGRVSSRPGEWRWPTIPPVTVLHRQSSWHAHPQPRCE